MTAAKWSGTTEIELRGSTRRGASDEELLERRASLVERDGLLRDRLEDAGSWSRARIIDELNDIAERIGRIDRRRTDRMHRQNQRGRPEQQSPGTPEDLAFGRTYSWENRQEGHMTPERTERRVARLERMRKLNDLTSRELGECYGYPEWKQEKAADALLDLAEEVSTREEILAYLERELGIARDAAEYVVWLVGQEGI